MSNALVGDDVLIINGRNFSDFADGDFFTVKPVNDIAKVKTGKNANSIFSQDWTGKNRESSLRLIRGSADDVFMNALLNQQNSGFNQTILMAGQYVKNIGDGAGNIAADTFNLSGGVFMKEVDGMSNAEGNTEQGVSVYPLKWATVTRAIV